MAKNVKKNIENIKRFIAVTILYGPLFSLDWPLPCACLAQTDRAIKLGLCYFHLRQLSPTCKKRLTVANLIHMILNLSVSL